MADNRYFNFTNLLTIIGIAVGVLMTMYYQAEHTVKVLPVKGTINKHSDVAVVLPPNEQPVEKKKVVNRVKPLPRIVTQPVIRNNSHPPPEFKTNLKPKNHQLSSCFCGQYVPNSSDANVLRSTINEPKCRSQKAMIIECENADDGARQCNDERDNYDGYYARKLICT